MSARTRIKRPTTATPRKVGTRRFLHVSTNYRWVGGFDGPAQFAKVGRGTTYRKESA
jgi:hypothetical protein